MKTRLFSLLALTLVAFSAAPACAASGSEEAVKVPDWSSYELADMSEYEFFEPYEKDFVFYDFTVKDILREMEEGKQFIVYASSPLCPWCKSTTPVLNDVATEAGVGVAYLNTRKDPSWESNLDVTDYDLFAEAFKDCLPLDDEGRVHLYTPHVFFIKDGTTLMDCPGAVSSYMDPEIPMTDEEKEEQKELYKEYTEYICKP